MLRDQGQGECYVTVFRAVGDGRNIGGISTTTSD